MPAREYLCRVIENKKITETVIQLRFEPTRKFKYEPGQFLSLIVPQSFAPKDWDPKRRIRRIYSFASDLEHGYELCVKLTGGPGPTFLASLKPGDTFAASAPYGDFFYVTSPNRGVCFVSIGSGIAPFLSMIQSRNYQDHPPHHAISVFGARDENEILYESEFHTLGVETVFALSAPAPTWRGYVGRVTDYLRSLPLAFPWHTTDFYLCGNGAMVEDVKDILRSRGVDARHIFSEMYFNERRDQDRSGLRVPLADRMKKISGVK